MSFTALIELDIILLLLVRCLQQSMLGILWLLQGKILVCRLPIRAKRFGLFAWGLKVKVSK
jgi:hypothetical protein